MSQLKQLNSNVCPTLYGRPARPIEWRRASQKARRAHGERPANCAPSLRPHFPPARLASGGKLPLASSQPPSSPNWQASDFRAPTWAPTSGPKSKLERRKADRPAPSQRPVSLARSPMGTNLRLLKRRPAAEWGQRGAERGKREEKGRKRAKKGAKKGQVRLDLAGQLWISSRPTRRTLLLVGPNQKGGPTHRQDARDSPL